MCLEVKGSLSWLPRANASGLLHMEIPQRAQRPRRPQSCAFLRGRVVLPLRQLISYNSTPVPAAVPPMDNHAWERVFQNAYALETRASLTETAGNYHFNIDSSCWEVAADHLENTARGSDSSECGFSTRKGYGQLVLSAMCMGGGSELAVNQPFSH